MGFISNVVKEGKKVKWTTRANLVKLTIFTLTVVILYSIFFIFSDMIIAQFLKLIAKGA